MAGRTSTGEGTTGNLFRWPLLFLPTAIGVSIIMFFLLHIIPGDYATIMVLGGEDRANLATEEEIQQVKEKLGLDRNVVFSTGTLRCSALSICGWRCRTRFWPWP